MSVIQRCEIKRHEPFKGDACPECGKIQANSQFAGWLVMGFIFLAGALAWMFLAKKF